MTIRHLKIFIAVVETGKMSTAAARCYISEPTVSQAIRELEEHYGVLLFERIAKKLYITEAGKNLFAYARMVVNQFDELEDNMLKGFSEKLRIGGTITVGSCIMPQLINQYRKIKPQVKTFVYINNTKFIEEKLLKSELDIGIVEGKIKSRDLVTIPMINDYLVIVCSKNHRLSGCGSISVKDLEKEYFIMREEGSGTRELFENYISRCGIRINVNWEATCPDMIKKAVISNNCLTAISARLIQEEAKKGLLYVIKSKGEALDRYFSLVYYKNKLVNDNMKSLMHLLEQYKENDILSGISTGTLVNI
ncbi:DNA-binding transcriptional LysR family regulator [Clostridium algifaecis]|uniref:DNA-binding transcriptional LysR family regulator n=1 Tax=Clostridium algifaecis TaxID=1472040 RepID=A0ABS4KQ54_9CLOT|nr:LysR family transcriptional regulator [Clostridium algifaecis]MBP2031506.1 DNA-binding transcriptional LysR family regulator [Clostridium algifaecis]